LGSDFEFDDPQLIILGDFPTDLLLDAVLEAGIVHDTFEEVPASHYPLVRNLNQKRLADARISLRHILGLAISPWPGS
jgi:hypothetical protein